MSVRQEQRKARAARLAADPTVVQHGRASTYAEWLCRCRPCRQAMARRGAVMRQARAARLAADPTCVPHGRASTYANHGCRCDPCSDAMRRSRR